MTAGDSRSLLLRRAAPFIALALLATLAAPLLVGGSDAVLRTLDFPARDYAILLGVVATNWIARALKLKLLLGRVGVRVAVARAVTMSLAIDFAFIGTPAGVGGYAACLYYLRRAGATTGAATAVTAADQVLDLAFFALALPVAAVSLWWSDLPAPIVALGLTTGAAMIAGGLVIALARRRIARWLLGDNLLVRRWSMLRRRQHVLREFLGGLDRNVRLLASGGRRRLLAITALTALQWLTRYGVLWMALLLLGYRVPFALVLVVQSLVLHAAMWTGVPSGGGGAELGLSAALALWVPATGMATALLLWRLVTFDVCLVVGSVAMLVLARRRNSVTAARRDETGTVLQGALSAD